MSDRLRMFLGGIAGLLERGSGEYFADGRLTVADLKVYIWLRQLRSGILDHVPADLPDRVAPSRVEHFRRIDGDPKVRQYNESR